MRVFSFNARKLHMWTIVLRLFYTITFLVAGLAHLFRPELFLPAMPPYLPWHMELVYLTGAVELLFLPFFWSTRFQKRSFQLAAVYLLLLLPAHIHVSINGVPMFGVEDIRLLWLRTLLQFPLVYGLYFLSQKCNCPQES